MVAAAEVIELRAGDARLRIAPGLGGRVTACELTDAQGRPHPVLRPYPEGHDDLEAWAKGGMYPLVPYSGRIRDGRLIHEGREWRLLPYGEGPHTLHGIAQRRPWQLVTASRAGAHLRYTHVPDGHWPWRFEAALSFRLGPCIALAQIALRNLDAEPMPCGIGLHPYLLHDAGDRVSYTADAPWPFDADYLAQPSPRSGAGVSRHRLLPRHFEAGELTRFHGHWQGALHLVRRNGLRLRLHADGALAQLVLHRPAASDYLCVEPVSHVPDGFNLLAGGQAGTGVRVLPPGGVLEGGLSIALEEHGQQSRRS